MPEDYLVTSDPKLCGGKPVVRGTRVPLQYILELWEKGYTTDKIHEQYPTVPKELIPEIVEITEKNPVIKISW